MLPILFTIPKIGSFGPFPIHTFGVVMLIAFVASMALARARAWKFGISLAQVGDASFWALIAGVLGARVVFIGQEWGYYSKHLDEVFSLKFSGLTSFGGLIFAVIALLFWAKRNKIAPARLFDSMAPAFLLGSAIGRVACFMNGCCYGGVCDPHAFLATQFVGVKGFHLPAQLYDAAMDGLFLLGLLAWEKRGLRMGQATGLAIAGYGLARFIYEFWRAGTDSEVAQGLATSTRIHGTPFTEAQAMAAVLVVGGLIWFFIARRNGPEFQPTTADVPVTPDLTPNQEALAH
ncbi:prolipoprotein diacylglyceryl transferase [soil metagenome]